MIAVVMAGCRDQVKPKELSILLQSSDGRGGGVWRGGSSTLGIQTLWRLSTISHGRLG
jgi:hypothetical protein